MEDGVYAICDYCKYFNPYYIRTDGGKFTRLSEGYCRNYNWKPSESHKILQSKERHCQYWEPISKEVERRMCTIFDRIESMQKDLSEITQMLKEDLDIKHKQQ